MHAPLVTSDIETLTRLNDGYIDAVRNSDVGWFREILAADFLCSTSDGSILGRAEFLVNSAKPYLIRELQTHDVNIRHLGDFAIVHARTTFRMPDGTPGSGRYTDVWARREGRWVAVAAHFTRK